jgi:outer membrane protein
VLRARADVLLVDVDKLRAYAAVLPQVGLSFGAQEIFGGRPWIESRFVCYDPPACVSVRPGGDYTVSFGPFFDAQANSFSQPQLSLGLSARQLVFDGGRWWTTIARNDELRARETAALRTVREAARLLAIRRFYDLVKAQEGVRFAVLQLGLSEAQLARARERVARGEGASDELAIAERNLATDRLSLAQRRFTASNQARFVNLAMGHAPEDRVEVVLPEVVDTATVPAIVLPPEDELLALALDARPELENTRAALRVVENNIQIRGADHWPQVALQGGYSRTSRRPDRVFSDPTEGYNATAGVTLSWPLSTGGAITASVREAELELEKGRASYEDLVRVVKAEVLEKRERLELLLQSYRLQDQSVRAAERARSLVQARYERGESNQLELRDAELRLTQALLARIEQRLEVEVGIAELERAIGAEVPRLEAHRPRR